jgi:hypothetical protein
MRGGSSDGIQSSTENVTDEEKKDADKENASSVQTIPKDDQEEEWEAAHYDDDDDRGPMGVWTEDEHGGGDGGGDLDEDNDTEEMFLDTQDFEDNDNDETVGDEIILEGFVDDDNADEFQGAFQGAPTDIEADATDAFHTEEVESTAKGNFQGEIVVEENVEMAEEENQSDYTDDEADAEQVGLTTTAPMEEAETVSRAVGEEKDWQEIVESEKIEEAASFATTTTSAASEVDESPIEIDLAQQHTTDDDSMAFVDRMELADDEGEAMLNGLTGDEMRESDERVTMDESEMVSETVQGGTVSEGWEETSTHDSFVIDDEAERILIKELKFRRHEVANMRPQIAAVLVEKRLERPWEGTPENWYKTDKSPRKPSLVSRLHVPNARKYLFRLVLLPQYAVPIVLGGLAVYGYVDLVEMFAKLVAELTPENLPSIEQETESENEYEGVPDAVDEWAPPTIVGGNAPIAPGAKVSDPKADEDATWLDKIITGIQKPIQAFWNIKI